MKAKKERGSSSLKPLYIRQVAGNFGNGVSGPYLPVYAVQLGASPSEMGWLRSLNNLFGNVMQIPWGLLSDKFERRVLFIALGSILAGLIWILMLSIQTPWQLIILIAAQALVNSMVAPAWASLIGDIVPSLKRGATTANLDAAASLGSIIASLISGIVMSRVGGSFSQMYTIPFIMAALSGLGASLTMLMIRERRTGKKRVLSLRSWINWRALRENVNFRRFCLFTVFHGFFMSMAWPLFPMTVVRVVKANMLQVAYISILSGSASLVIRRFVGRLADRAGRKPLIIFGRAAITLYPIIYAFATSVYHLFIADFFIGIVGAIGDIVIFVYLLDITPEDQRGTTFAIYNTLNGFATFFGSLSGGYLVSLFMAMGFGEIASMQWTYGISAVGRLVGGLLFTKIGEPYVYPSTIRGEIKQMVAEDVDRARERIDKVEKVGEVVQDDLEKDFDWFEDKLSRRDKEEK